LLEEICRRGVKAPVIIITGAPSIETATESLRRGAFDYIIKPLHQETILRTVHVALKHKSLIEEKEKCRRNYESIFRSVREGIITCDQNMAITDVNEAAQAICHLQPEQVIGKNSLDLPRRCTGKCLESLQRTHDSRQPQTMSYIECSADPDRQQVVSITTTPLLGANREFSGIVMLIRDKTQLVRLKRSLEMQSQDTRLVGKSESIRKLRSMIRDLADIQTTVLITGESGTGKEVVVEELHLASERCDFPLVRVNCAALSEELLESELFGHVKGAFTGAIRDKIGRFQRADGGTLFLDEIGDISPRMQARLLRAIETMEFERVGDSTPLRVDVRLVAATNRNLKNLVSEGRFRQDLYYRLKVVEIHLPPLRQRQEDIPLLVNHFLNIYNRKFDKQIKAIATDAWNILGNAPWPGNIRELANTLEYAFVCCPADLITTAHLPPDFLQQNTSGGLTASLNDDEEIEAIQRALEQAHWNKSKAADLLGISRRTMYRKMKKHGLSLT
jgi:PAS domain S-box-containing protein